MLRVAFARGGAPLARSVRHCPCSAGSVRYHVLACDYDGTLASDGAVAESTIAALKRLVASGRKLVLVTGRELPQLLEIFPGLPLFEWVVAENGALLYRPATHEELPLGAPPPENLLSELRARGVAPLAVGRVIVATWEPHEATVLEVIRTLGLELQVIFNKGAVMVLPAGINKQSGLQAALERMRLSAHNCVGVGDAENDHAFLAACGFSVAVANALPAVKNAVDWVTSADHGAGVCELIEQLLDDELHEQSARSTRHEVPLGTLADGGSLGVPAFDAIGLVAGGSGGGKTSAVTGFLEQLIARDYQVCVIDPEGDHSGLEGAVIAGTAEQAPEPEQIFAILDNPRTHAVVNLLAVPVADRPTFFLSLLTRLHEARALGGRPHWIVIDEAHHVLSGVFEPVQRLLSADLASVLFVTVHPERLHVELLQRVNFFVAVGQEASSTLEEFARARRAALPRAPLLPEQPGEVLFWRPAEAEAVRLRVSLGRSAQRRHRRKYAHGELGPDKSFYFRGPHEKLNLRAQNLVTFNELGAGVDEETWLFHLQRGDYSAWVRDAIKDRSLADEIAQIEAEPQLSVGESRERIRAAIERIYTAPA